jgi:D-inositol-3-phosphate glycosyltransferase
MKNAVSGARHQETTFRGDIERRLVRLADSVIAANPDERADLIWRQHTPADKVCTIPPGVDVELFNRIDRDRARGALGLPADRQIALFVGRIDPIKGIDTLIDAAAALRQRGCATPLFVFVGGDLDDTGRPVGPLADVVAQAEQLGILADCHFVGAQPQHTLPLYYSAADITVVPSRYESFGLVAVESMACGTPVIASHAGGLTFTIDDGEDGLLVPHDEPSAFADAIEQLLGNDTLRTRMSLQAELAAQRFAWDSIAESVLHLYQRLANGQRGHLCCDEEIFA